LTLRLETLVSCMARCQLVIGLCVIHLCFALSYGGFDYDPRLIPQAPSYYTQPQPNPYANPYGPYPYPQQGPYYPPYPEQEPAYPTNFLEEEQDQTPSGSATPATTGGAAATATNTASVQTPPATSNSDTSTGPTSTSNMDALDIQLAAALEAVKADMISKGKEVLEEKQWTDDVKGIIAQYTTKISNVYANIEKLKTDMGSLYKKKQQIINAQIQKSLTQKLKDSKSDLQTVQAALDKVTNTQMEFEQSKKDIQSTIDSIFAQLNELKGLPASGATGSASGSASSSTDTTSSPTTSSPSTSSFTDTTSSSTDTSAADTDIVDQTAEINSKIDTIKSIVSALNSGSSPSTTS